MLASFCTHMIDFCRPGHIYTHVSEILYSIAAVHIESRTFPHSVTLCITEE